MATFAFVTKTNSAVVSIDGGNQIPINGFYSPVVLLPVNKELQLNPSTRLSGLMDKPNIHVDNDTITIDAVPFAGATAQDLYDALDALFFLDDSGGGGGIPEAPEDGNTYGRKDAGWTPVSVAVPPVNVFSLGAIEPVVADILGYKKTDRAITVTEVNGLRTNGQGNATVTVKFGADVSLAGTTLATGTITSGTTGTNLAISNGAVPVNNFIWVTVDAFSSGVTVTNLSLNLKY